MGAPDNIKVIRDEEFIQEGEIRLTVPNLGEVRNAIAVLNNVRKQVLTEMDVDMEEPEDGETVITSVEYRVEGDFLIAHVTQGLVE